MGANTRYYVALNLYGQIQFYERDSEVMGPNKRWMSQPRFVVDSKAAAPMLEAPAVALVHRLRGLKEDPWLVTMEGQRVDVPEEGQPTFTEDNRGPVRATLDSDAAVANGTAVWYLVKPARTPNGLRWVVTYNIPGSGRPIGQDQIYRDSAVECLERAQELHVLQYCEPAPAPEAPRPAPVQKAVGPRVRPGDCR